MLNLLLKLIKNMKLINTPSRNLTPKELKRKKKVRNRFIGYTLIMFQIVMSMVFSLMLFDINILPGKYFYFSLIVLIIITIYNIASQYTKAHLFGKILAIFLSIILFTGSLYIGKTNDMLKSISNATVKTDYFSIIVLNDVSATTLSEAVTYSYGYNSSIDQTNSQKVIEKINKELETTLKTNTYDSWDLLVKALYDKSVKAIIINETYRSVINEKFPDFNQITKILDSVKFETKLATVPVKDVINEPFTIYIAGNDESGKLNSSGKNDVNILATFNPENRQVILVTTPRDYYINVHTLSEKGIKVDKLTHAGNFGIDASMETLENLYGLDVDYFVRLNFTGTVGIVDALGGISVDSEVAFSTSYDTNNNFTYNFNIGANECDGEKALAFCRERYAFTLGDNQRGRNQMFAIQGIIKKATSPAILTSYMNVMSSVSDMFLTSMPQDTITSLIKDMLNDKTPWNIQTYNVTALEYRNRPSTIYTNDPELRNMEVSIPDYNSVNTAIKLMSKIRNGDVFNLESFLEGLKQNTSSSY